MEDAGLVSEVVYAAELKEGPDSLTLFDNGVMQHQLIPFTILFPDGRRAEIKVLIDCVVTLLVGAYNKFLLIQARICEGGGGDPFSAFYHPITGRGWVIFEGEA